MEIEVLHTFYDEKQNHKYTLLWVLNSFHTIFLAIYLILMTVLTVSSTPDVHRDI